MRICVGRYTLRQQNFIYVILIILILLCSPIFSMTKDEGISFFVQANELYKKGDYKKAIEIYEKIINSGFHNGHIYYNLGNSYFRLGKIGKSILNYRRALILLPRDSDLKKNLDYARSEIKDKIELGSYTQIFQRFFFWYYSFNLIELIWIFLIFNLLFWIFLTIFIYKKNEAFKWSLGITFVISIILFFSCIFKIMDQYYQYKGVIISQEVEVQSGNDKNSVVLFKLHEGSEVNISKIQNDWYQIELPDGKRGWLQKMAIDII